MTTLKTMFDKVFITLSRITIVLGFLLGVMINAKLNLIIVNDNLHVGVPYIADIILGILTCLLALIIVRLLMIKYRVKP